jgi:hypothetical protein
VTSGPIDWDNYEIPLYPAGAAPPRPTAELPGAPRLPRSRPRGRPALRALGRSSAALAWVFAAGVVAGVVWDLAFYERFWGRAPDDRALLLEWLGRRAFSLRLVVLCGGVVGELALWVYRELSGPDKSGLEESEAALFVRWTLRGLRWLLLLWWLYLVVGWLWLRP